jgi:hypothetical protein
MKSRSADRGRPVKRGRGQRRIAGEDFNLGDEVAYIQQRAAHRDGRIVTVGPVLLFSTETGDAWLLDPADQLAAPVAREGTPLPVPIEDSRKTFAIVWPGTYAIVGEAFVFHDGVSGRVTTFVGYPTRQLSRQISKMPGRL